MPYALVEELRQVLDVPPEDTSADVDLQRALDAALARVGTRVEADAVLLEGDVVDTLASLDPRDADLLVCGSRAYGPLRRVLLGGVSSRLLRRSALPLLVVPRSGDPGP